MPVKMDREVKGEVYFMEYLNPFLRAKGFLFLQIIIFG